MKNRSKKFLLAAMAGLLIFSPARSISVYATAGNAGQVSSSSDSKLSELDIAPGTLSPAFSPDVLEYTATVDVDVTDLNVRAIPRAAGGTIASVEGARSISPGTNTVKVTCSAPDNSYTVYSITVTAGGSPQAPADSSAADPGQADGGTTGGETQGASGQGADTQADNEAGQGGRTGGAKLLGKIAGDGTVTLDGAAYKLSNNFSYSTVTQDIPSDFVQGSVQIGGNNYSTFHCEANDVHLVFMENTDGNGSTGFYFYDDQQNAVERFKYTGIGENFVVFISSARAQLPPGYKKKKLTLPSGKAVTAYKNTASKNLKDYYLVYGINSDGTDGWYLYDKAQGTYMRYAQEFAVAQQEPEPEEPIERTVTLNKYNLQVEKYNELKSTMVKIVSVFVVALLLLIILFTALLFRSRDAREADWGEEKIRSKKTVKKMQKAKDQVGKNSLAAGRILDRESAGAEAKKITKTILSDTKAAHRAAAANLKDRISTPDEIRKIQQEQLAQEQQNKLGQRRSTQEQETQARLTREQEMQSRLAREQETPPRLTREQEMQVRLAKEQEQQARLAREQETQARLAREQEVKTRLPQEPQARLMREREQQAGLAQEMQPSYDGRKNRQALTEEPLTGYTQEQQPSYDGRPQQALAGEQRYLSQGQQSQLAGEKEPQSQLGGTLLSGEPEPQTRLTKEQEQRVRMLREQEQQARLLREQEQRTYAQEEPVRPGVQQQDTQPAAAPDSVQIAAEKMRQSVQYTHKSAIAGAPQELSAMDRAKETGGHDPMDDWEVEDTMAKRRSRKKRRGHMDEDDMEIMDLNDL